MCPLSLQQVSKAELKEYVLPVWLGKQSVIDIEYSYECGVTEVVAVGYECSVTQSTQEVNWNERRLIVRSLKAAQTGELALGERLQKAQVALSDLSERRRGKKVLRTIADWRQATEKIIKHYRVTGLLQLNYQVLTKNLGEKKIC